MNHALRTLEQIQRWMHAVCTHPDGVPAGVDSLQARSAIDIPPGDIESVVNRSSRRTGIERLEVYANAYYARLLECLRDEFPALVHAVGEDVFDGFAFGYLQSEPPSSYTLGELGRRFPDYLEKTRPRCNEEIDDSGGRACPIDEPAWPDFLVDLARLERTYSEVFDGPGTERHSPLQIGDIKATPLQDWPECRLIAAPCLRLLSLRFPVQEYATAVRKKSDPPIPESCPTWLAVTRIDYVVRRWSLSRIQYELLRSLVEETTVGEAIEFAAGLAAEMGESTDTLVQKLRNWFEEWSAARFFAAIERPASHDRDA